MDATAFSAIMMVGAFVFPVMSYSIRHRKKGRPKPPLHIRTG